MATPSCTSSRWAIIKCAACSSRGRLFLVVFVAVHRAPNRGFHFRFRTATGYSAELARRACFVRGVQVEELTPRMGHAADFSDTECKTGFVTTKIIADQLALPVLQEVACMFARAAGAEVVHHCADIGRRGGCIGPDEV